MRKTIAWVSLAVGSSACFSPEPVTGSTDSNETVTDTSAGPTGPDSSSDSESMTSMTGMSGMTSTSDPDSTVSMTTSPDSTGTPELGPQLVMSIPADGDGAAPLGNYFFLYFDRVVSTDDATGHIYVTQGGGEPQPVSAMPCPPDADPTCVAGIFPAAFTDPDTGNLPGSTEHTIIVEADFPDPDGAVNSTDQVVSFTTFELDANFFDDSDVLSTEFGGLAYDPGSESLFLVGVDGNECAVRRVPVPGGVAGGASTAALPTGSNLCYGMDAIDGVLYVSGSYTDNVFRYTGLDALNLGPTETIISNPNLMPPLDSLSEVWSVARGGGSTFFAHGEFTGGIEDTSILRLTDANVWSEFQSGENLWEDADGVTIVGANYDGADHLIVAADGQIFKFRISDASLVSSAELNVDYAPDLQVDSAGRLWVGDSSGVRVVNAETDSYEILAQRMGFEANRLALREDGNTVHAYFARFRDQAVIGHLSIDF